MKRTPTFIEALVPLLGMVLLLGIGYGKYGLPIQFLLIVAAFIASIIAKRCGYTWQDMITGIADKIQSSLPSLLVMVCVGAMIGSWMVSGTIPMLIYYGIKIIDPQFLFVTAFFVTAVISTFTGTSFGSAGTAGVAIMGIAIALGVPLEIAAGAVISGAVFGDKLSPLSDTTMLAPIAAGTDLYSHIRHMLYTTGAATITCMIVFTVVGLNMDVSTMTNPETVNAILGNLEQLYHFNLLLLLPPALIFWGGIYKETDDSDASSGICDCYPDGNVFSGIWSQNCITGFCKWIQSDNDPGCCGYQSSEADHYIAKSRRLNGYDEYRPSGILRIRFCGDFQQSRLH